MAYRDDYEGQRRPTRGPRGPRGDRQDRQDRDRRPAGASKPPRPNAPAMAAGARTGRYVRAVADKGFGFIKDAVALVDCFFHKTDYRPQAGDRTYEQLIADPEDGTLLVFRAEETEKGWRARDVSCAIDTADQAF